MSVLVAPVLTEKSVLGIDKGLYVFAVTTDASKTSITDELKKLYNVDAISVRIVNLPAQKVVFRRKSGVRSVRRKAYVQLAPKQVIPGFELNKGKDAKDKTEKKNEETK